MAKPGAAAILAFHGGGFLGYFSALVAAALDDRRRALGAKGPLKGAFDVICGTSVGAIMAAGIAAGVPPARIVALMAEEGGRIFPKRWIAPTMPGIFGARFSLGPLRALLEEILGDLRLGEIDRPLLLPAVNETAGVPVVFRSHDARYWDIRVVDAVLASAAAPLYLPLHRIAGDRHADGGMVANAPGLLAAADLVRCFGVPTATQRIVSIGTTFARRQSPVPTARSDAWGGIGWIWRHKRLQDLLMGGQEAIQSDILAALGPAGWLHLDIELDAARAERVHMVRADARARATLEEAAAACLNGITPAERNFLDLTLSRRARALACARGAAGLSPLLLAAEQPDAFTIPGANNEF